MSTITKLAHPFTVWDSLLYETLPVSITVGRQAVYSITVCPIYCIEHILACGTMHYILIGNLLYYYTVYTECEAEFDHSGKDGDCIGLG